MAFVAGWRVFLGVKDAINNFVKDGITVVMVVLMTGLR